VYYLFIYLHILLNVVDAVLKKFPNIQDSKEEIKRSIMTWLAQAPTRIIRLNLVYTLNDFHR